MEILFALLVFSVPVLNLFFAFGVFGEAYKHNRRPGSTFLSPALWFFATVLGGPVVALMFWIIHCSTLNPKNATPFKSIGSRVTPREQLYDEGLIRYGNSVDEEEVAKYLES